MSRPVFVYLIMIAVLIGGLWSVLAIGRTLSAPEDLAGKWQLEPARPGGGPWLTIDQSGKFFQLTMDDRPNLDLKLADEHDSTMTLTNSTWQMTLTGKPGGDDKIIELTGPKPGKWAAHRTVRTFPADKADKGTH